MALVILNILFIKIILKIKYILVQVTPLVSQLSAFGAKIASCLNPIAFALNHPVYRQVLSEKMPCLGFQDERKPNASEMKTEAEA